MDTTSKFLPLPRKAQLRLILPLVAMLTPLSPAGAGDRNVQVFADFVVPAYTAMNLSMMCVRIDAQFLSANIGPRGNVLHYAEHVKDEAIASLTESEARVALKAAADEALLIARTELRRLSREGQTVAMDAVADWCATHVRNFVQDFIDRHDRDHTLLLQQLELALKQPPSE